MKKMLRITAYFAVFCLCLYLLWLTPPVKNYVKQTVESALFEKTGLKISLNKIQWRPPLTLAVKDVHFKKNDGTEVYIEEVYFRPSLREMLRGVLSIRALHFNHIEITPGEKKEIVQGPVSVPKQIPESLFVCPLEVSDLRIENVHIQGFSAYPLENLILQGNISCPSPKEGWSASFSLKQKNHPGSASLNVAVDSASVKKGAMLILEEKQGGVFLSHFIGGLAEEAKLLVSYLGDGTGHAELRARGASNYPWNANTRAQFTIGETIHVRLENSLKGILKGIQDLSLTYSLDSSKLTGTLKGDLEGEKYGVFTFAAKASGTKDLIKGSIEAANSSQSAALEFDFNLAHLESLKLSNIQGSWKEAVVKGDLQGGMNPQRIEGSLAFERLQSLNELLPTLPVNVGPLEGHILLTYRDGHQNADVRLSSSDVTAQEVGLENVYLHLVLQDIFGAFTQKFSGKIDRLLWNNLAFGPLKFTTKIAKGVGRPFVIELTESNGVGFLAKGFWSAYPGKFSFRLSDLTGAIHQLPIKLQRPFEFTYDNGLASFSPFLLNLSEGTIYFALNEIGNNFELSSYYLNLSAPFLSDLLKPFDIPIAATAPAYWNVKARLRWSNDLDVAKLTITAANKDTSKATTLSLDLKQEQHKIVFDWEIQHPRNGVLTLFKDNMSDVQFQLQNEWVVYSPTLVNLFTLPTLPMISGHSVLSYNFQAESGQILTHFSHEDQLFRLLGINAKGDTYEAEGNLAYNNSTGELSGSLNAKAKAVPANAEIKLEGKLNDLRYTAGIHYAVAEENVMTFSTAGKLSSEKLQGSGQSELSLSGSPIVAKADYEIALDEQLTSKILITSSYTDTTKNGTNLGKIVLETHLDGPLSNLKGKAQLMGSGARLDGNKLPPWNITSELAFPAENLPIVFSMNSTFTARGALSATEKYTSFVLSQLDGIYNNQKIHLAKDWTIDWREAQLSLSPLLLEIGNGSLTIDGKADREAFQFLFKGKDIQATFALPGEYHMPVAGKISLEGAFDGPWGAPQGLFHIAADDMQITDKFFGKAPPCHAALDLTIKPTLVSLQGEITCPGIEPLVLQATVPASLSLSPFKIAVDRDQPIDVALKVAGALGPVLDIFLPHITSITGYLSLAVNIKGSINKPLITGLMALDNGSFENLETGTILNNISFKAHADGTHVLIDSIKAYDRQDGSLTGKGTLVLDDTKDYPFEISTHLDHVLLVQTDLVRSAFEGDVVFKGDINGMKILGNVEPVQAMLYIPEEIPEGTETVDVIFVNVPEDRERKNYEKAPSGSSYPTVFDLNVNTNHRIHILGRGLESTWKGQAHLSGPLANPNVQGDVKIIKGTYVFKGRIFDIHEGTIAFSGPWETKTKLYVIASQEVDDIIVEAILRGPLKNPSLSFRSNPPMPQRDIVSFLLFGKGASEISPYQGNELSRSISNLRSVDDSPDILTRVRSRLNIDRLDINREVTSQGDKVSVQVGKYVCKGVYVSLNKSITEDSNSIAIDAKVTKHVRARAEVTDNAETQLLLKWKHDF